MPQAIWYFAIGDQEKGPVSEAQIKMLIGTGNLTRDDLVWRDGMEDWMPAGDVAGLFDKQSTDASKDKDKKVPKARPDKSVVSPKLRTDAPNSEPTPVEPTPPTERAPRRLTFTPPKISFDIGDVSKLAGHPLLILGLLTVLFARGCDSLAVRYADRVVARSETVEKEFESYWESRLDRAKGNLSEQRDLQREMQLERADLESGRWKTLKSAAATADANNKMWAFWRQMMFVAGTFVLVMGLFFVAHHSEGAERWMALAILAIIVYSLYVSIDGWTT